MATIYARSVMVPVCYETLTDDINAATEVLETAGFVVQGLEARNFLDSTGISRQVVLVNAVERHLMPGGVLYPVSDLAKYGVGYVRHTGVSSDGETVTVQGRVYEYDTGGAVAPGSILVDISGGNSATQSATALAAAVNGDAGAVVQARASGSVVTLVGKSAVTAFTLAETLANGVVSGAAMVGGAAVGDRYLGFVQYTATAADVLTWAASGEVPIACVDDPGTAPRAFVVQVVDASGGLSSPAGVSANVVRVNANNYAVVVEDPLAVMNATDVIYCGLLA